jgi:hypothetical protein
MHFKPVVSKVEEEQVSNFDFSVELRMDCDLLKSKAKTQPSTRSEYSFDFFISDILP